MEVRTVEWNEVQVTIHQFSGIVETQVLLELLLKAKDLETAYDDYPEANSAHELIDDLYTASTNLMAAGPA